MKRCLGCDGLHPLDAACGNCGFAPQRIDGFDAYAPDLAHEGGGFDAAQFPKLAAVEATNFWFRARNELLRWAIRRHAPTATSFLEIGCGTGYVIAGIAQALPRARLWGSEIFTAGLAFAARRLPGAKFIQMDARNIPFQDEFDAIGMFDVLEHISEDSAVLQQAHAALKSGGVLLLTVPQHRWLWSHADEVAHHVRRYPAHEIHAKVAAAGFEIQHSTSFVALLLPAMYASRARKKNAQSESSAGGELALPRPLNAIFYGFMALEIALIRAGLKWPVGGSRLVVARKAAPSAT
jgi:SAM-dependent methyltransferase